MRRGGVTLQTIWPPILDCPQGLSVLRLRFLPANSFNAPAWCIPQLLSSAPVRHGTRASFSMASVLMFMSMGADALHNSPPRRIEAKFAAAAAASTIRGSSLARNVNRDSGLLHEIVCRNEGRADFHVSYLMT
jgi:hypothetical protein